MTNKQTKKRLFIVAGTFTTAISAALIKQLGQKDCEDYLVSIAPLLYENLDNHIKVEAIQLGLFKQILFYFDFCRPKSEFKNEKTHILSFNVKKFREATNNVQFDEIYSVYIHGAANYLFNQYPQADLYFMEDGVAAYLKMENAERINNRAKKIYTLNYFDKIKPFITLKEKVKTETIKKDILKTTFKQLAGKINFQLEKKEKAIIFCTQNISLNKAAMTYETELKLYENNVKKLLDKGYCVYFKEHPKTPNMFYKNLQKTLNNPNLINIGDYNVLPVEELVVLLKPFAVVSMFSSALLTLPHIFDIPTFTFFAEKEFQNHDIFGIAHLIVAAYIPSIDVITNDIFETRQAFDNYCQTAAELSKQPIYNIKNTDFFKLFISQKEFKMLQKEFKTCNKSFLQYANIPQKVQKIFEQGNYVDFLMHYSESYKKAYEKYKQTHLKNDKKQDIIKLLKDSFRIIQKLLF